MRKLLLVLVFVISLISFSSWYTCRDFSFFYHFSAYDLELQLTSAIHADNGPVFVTRIFHNKVLFFFLDIYKRYTQFFDLNLLVSALSLAGVLGVIFGFFYFLKSKKNLITGLLFAAALTFPLFEVLLNFKIMFALKLAVIFGPFLLISIYGHNRFMENKSKKSLFLFYLILSILSIALITAYPQAAYTYCVPPVVE